MPFPKISVVTPSFNQGEFLEETILSVLSQNYPNLEYIIIDGGSTDNSVDIIKKYESQLTLWISEKDEGMYHAIQKGFEHTTGEIMTWINSDDLLFKNSLHRVADIFLRYSSVKWLGGSICQIDESSQIVCTAMQDRWNRFRFYNFDYQFIQQEGTFWRRKLWDQAGAHVSRSFKFASDLELWLRFFKYAEYHTLSAPLGSFRLRRSNQKSLENRNFYLDEAERAISAYPVSASDQSVLNKYHFYLRYVRRLPFVGAMGFIKKYYTAEFLRYPKQFHFDQVSQTFKIVSE
jgi:glycosyltransferase involved in cell wall biosynthesis